MGEIQTLYLIFAILFGLIGYIIYLLIQCRKEYIKIEKALRRNYGIKVQDILNSSDIYGFRK